MLNDAGQTAFVGFLTGNGTTADNDSGLWSEGQGNGLALVARAGDAAPGLGSGVTLIFSVTRSQGSTTTERLQSGHLFWATPILTPFGQKVPMA